ncbi:MAG: BamA/TamA family outer membrane protein [Bacteroidota bacterium]|nr:BamA/TamA family outer membrane protein [Bacteroidota bacterium]
MRINQLLISFLLIVSLLASANLTDSILSTSVKKEKKVRMAGLPNVFYGPETRFGLGADAYLFFKLHGKDTAANYDSITRTSFIKASIQGTQNKQYNFQGFWQGFTNRDRIFFDGWVGYQQFPQLYWKLGPKSPDEPEAIDYKFAWAYQKLLFKATKNLYVGGQYVFLEMWDLKTNLNGVDILQSEKLTGGTKGYVGSGFGIALHYDNRNNIVNSLNGTYAEFTFQQFNKTLGASNYWDWMQIDIRKFINTSKKLKHVLALQFKANSVFGDPPFLEFNGIMLRGYYSGRYRERHFILSQAEYRFPVYKRFGMVVFGGAGNATNTYINFDFNSLKPSYGLGLRFKLIKKDDVNLRLDYAWGYQSEAWYLSLTEYF